MWRLANSGKSLYPRATYRPRAKVQARPKPGREKQMTIPSRAPSGSELPTQRLCIRSSLPDIYHTSDSIPNPISLRHWDCLRWRKNGGPSSQGRDFLPHLSGISIRDWLGEISRFCLHEHDWWEVQALGKMFSCKGCQVSPSAVVREAKAPKSKTL